MPSVYEFDTQTVRAWTDPKPVAQKVIRFRRPFVANPRAPHGIRALDISNCANIRLKSTVAQLTSDSADCRIEAWADTVLFSAVDHILTLAPADIDFLTGEYMRTPSTPASTRINFERPFVTPPRVVVFFNHIDLGRERNWRFRVSASTIDANGFTLSAETWGDTILYSAQACWIAYPEDRERIFSTSVQAKRNPDIVNYPQLQHSKDITFCDVSFSDTPSVFVALNYIDVDCKANLRLNSYVDNVSHTGLTCHLGSWADTIVYAAGASVIALN